MFDKVKNSWEIIMTMFVTGGAGFIGANFGKWVGVDLSVEKARQQRVSPGFVNGFMVISDLAVFFYKIIDYWYPEHNSILLWYDSSVCVQYLVTADPKFANKDTADKMFVEADYFDK